MSQPSDEARDVSATSVVKEVTVYESSAQIHRHCTTRIAKGTSRIIFDDLPSNLDRDSLQVAIAPPREGAKIVLRGISFDQITRTVTVDDARASEEEQRRAADARRIKELEGQVQGKQDEIAVLQAMSNINDQMFAKATRPTLKADELERITDVEMWAKVVAQYNETYERHFYAIRRAEAEVKALEEEIGAIRRGQYGNAGPATTTTTKNVVAVGLTASEDVADALIALSYVVGNASWSAEYDVRFNGQTQAISLGYNALVRQTTAEDWRDVKITLSTARPALCGKQPELAPWRVSVYVPAPRMLMEEAVMFKKSAKKLKGGFLGGARDKARHESEDDDDSCFAVEDYVAPAIEEAAVDDNSSTSVSFVIPQLTTVPRDNDPQRLTVAQVPLQATVTHTAVPSLVQSAFAQAKIKNTSSFVLVSGPVSVFVDNQLVTTSSIARVGPSEDFTLSLGRDEGITVTQKLLHKKRVDESAGLFSGKTNILKHSYMTTVKNNKKVPVTIVLQERIPVSNDSTLVVELVAPLRAALTAKQVEKMEAEGLVDQELTLKAGELVDVPFAFNVKHPQDKTVYGM